MFSLPSSFSAHDLGSTTTSSSYQASSSINNDQIDDEYTSIGYGGNNQYEDDENDYEPESGSDSASDSDYDDEIGGAIIKPIQNTNQDDDMYHTMTSHSSSAKIKKKQRKIREKRESEKKEKIISKLSRPDHPQYDRYENYTRSTFKPVMKRLINNSTSTPSTNKNVEITIAGIAKVYVGELVELSKIIQKEWGEDTSSPIEPRHLREAYRRNREQQTKKKKYAFR